MARCSKHFPSIFLVIFIIGLTGSALGQKLETSIDEPKTKLESFQHQIGAVFIKGQSEIGKVRGLGATISIFAMEITDVGTQTKHKGMAIAVEEGKKYGNSSQSFIDYDEIDQLVGGIEYVGKIQPGVTELDKFEATYSTNGNLRVTTFTETSKISAAVKTASIGGATAYLSLDQLNEFKNIISLAKKKLDSLN